MIPTDLFSGVAAPWHFGALIFGYLLGSIPFGLILAKLFGLGDLRAIGSGNIGATNVLRTGNKAAAALTLVFDALKGFLAVWLAARYGPVTAGIAAVGAVVGHCYPVWLRFQGGKGVATYIGALLGLYWPVAVAFCALWLVMALIFRISSLAALVAAAATPVVLFLMNEMGYILFAVVLAALVFWRHRANIARLLKGEEPRIGRK